tara:strand:- start:570 stop:1157 length:588 start_codon:yes stop_codon:yes gene_type:complete
MAKNGRKNKKNGKNGKNGSKSLGNSLYKLAKNASGYLAFASQLTAKDYSDLNATTSYKNEDIATKAKIFANIVTGRLTGIHAFKGANLYGSDEIQFTINPSGVVNKFTGLGVAGLIYKNLPMKQLPQKSKVGAVAKNLLVGGALGGLFDPPMNSPSQSQTMASSPKVLGVQQQNRMATMQTGMYSESADSTGGSF